MRTGLIICTLVLTQISATKAADLRTPAPPLPVVLSRSSDPVPLWSGFYVGVSGAYSFGKSDLVLSPSPDFLTVNPSPQMFDFIAARGTSTIRPTGFGGGFQAGYKTQAGGVVVGVEADWSHLGSRQSTSTGILLMPDGTTTVSFSQSASISQLATLRGIIGVPVGNFLPYLTGGVGVGWESVSQSILAHPIRLPVPCVCWSGQTSRTKAGWVVGAGIEYMISTRVSAKTEYLYSDLGSLQFTTLGPIGLEGLDLAHSARFTNQIARVGLNF